MSREKGSPLLHTLWPQDFSENFRDTNPIVQSYGVLVQRMGTAGTLDVLIDAPDPSQQEEFSDFLNRLRQLQQAIHREPGVHRQEGL